MPSRPSLLLPFVAAFLLGGLLVFPPPLLAQTPSPSAPAPQASPTLRSYRGDVSLSLSLGVQAFSFSYATGEPIARWLDPNGFDLLLFPEYGYFFRQNMMFFISLPMTFYISPVLGTLFTLQIGLGLRYFLGRWFFVDAQALLSFWRRSLFAPDFGGFLFGLGAALPLQERFRLLITMQIPLNFFDGFRFGWNVLAGAEILF